MLFQKIQLLVLRPFKDFLAKIVPLLEAIVQEPC